MRPILMAGGFMKPPLTFTPPSGTAIERTGGISASAGIHASEPVVWNWSADGDLPTSNVPNGGTGPGILFTLSNSSTSPKSCFITVTSGDNTWTVELTANGRGGGGEAP